MSWPDRLRRAGPWCGILVPGLDTLVNGVDGALQPHYHPAQDYISAMTAPNVPYAGLLRACWIAFPFLFAPFVYALYAHLKPSRFAPVAPALVAAAALALLFCGVFHCDPGCEGRTFSARAHFLASDVMGAALFLGPFGLWLALHRYRLRRCFRLVNLSFPVAGAATGGLLFLAGWGVLPMAGLYERIYYGVFYVWFVLLALHMLWNSPVTCCQPSAGRCRISS